MRHDFIKTGDADAYSQIQDRNGEVCLSQCRRCGQAEGELTPECPGVTARAITDDQILALRHEVERVTATALGEDGVEDLFIVNKARSICADLVNTARINARAKESK